MVVRHLEDRNWYGSFAREDGYELSMVVRHLEDRNVSVHEGMVIRHLEDRNRPSWAHRWLFDTLKIETSSTLRVKGCSTPSRSKRPLDQLRVVRHLQVRNKGRIGSKGVLYGMAHVRCRHGQTRATCGVCWEETHGPMVVYTVRDVKDYSIEETAFREPNAYHKMRRFLKRRRSTE